MKNVVVFFIIGAFIGCIIPFFVVSVYIGEISANSSYGILEWVYYITQPIGVLATLFAVIVALFGKEIRSFFFKEHCNVTLINSGFYENLGCNNTPNPTALSYDCQISLSNDGSRQIDNCELILKEVWFKQDNTAKSKRIFSADHKALYWSYREIKDVSLLVGDSRKLPLFKIYPDASCQTPDASMTSSLCIRVIGCQLLEKYIKKGIWSAKYEIRTQTKVLQKFEVEARWDGVWCNRSTEMDEHVSATLNIVKE